MIERQQFQPGYAFLPSPANAPADEAFTLAARPRLPDDLPDVPRGARGLAIDLLQMALDLVGFADPTPISDGLSTLLSLARGDWAGAAVSAISMIPFAGDTFKMAKLQGMADVLEDAVRYVVRNPNEALMLRQAVQSPLFDAILRAADQMVGNTRVPEPARAALERIAGAIRQLRGP